MLAMAATEGTEKNVYCDLRFYVVQYIPKKDVIESTDMSNPLKLLAT